ncbi:hemolysin III family protein [soil metagenome]
MMTQPSAAPARGLQTGSGMNTAKAREELFNAWTHGVGALASVIAASVLITRAAIRGGIWETVGAAVFGVCLLTLYAASTLYHAARAPEWRRRFKIFDHCAIFLLIAGTYTPFLLHELRGAWGWTLFAVVWTFAVAGIVFKLFCTGRYRVLSTLTYLGMGWLCVVATGPLLEHVAPVTLAWIAAGGIAYTVGTPFYHARRPYAHAIWHGFVLLGSACHVIAVATQVS